jgi:phosphoribosylformylglycinamidine (FGAM) synthase PurS component
MQRCAAIRLKIPDNEAYTALTTLQRLGIKVAKLERTDILRIDDNGDPATIPPRIERDESIFNPNKHALMLLETCTPRSGETWIEEIDTGKTTGWRLFDSNGKPATRETVRAAAERLLCNPAIERAIEAQ